jgi:hypothetical protein
MVFAMTKLEEIKHAITALPREDIFALAGWFAKFHAELWGNQIESTTAIGLRKNRRRPNSESAKAGSRKFGGTTR